jgi:uncharacterized RDD family membrane protein YckC
MENASLRRRLASMGYESLLLIGVLSATFMLPYLLLGMIWQVEAAGWIELLHLILVLGIYFSWLWCHGGQTLAMQTWKLRLVSAASGGTVTWPQALLRYALCWLSLLLCGAGLLWAIVDRDHQFLHDRLAGTRIVFKE